MIHNAVAHGYAQAAVHYHDLAVQAAKNGKDKRRSTTSIWPRDTTLKGRLAEAFRFNQLSQEHQAERDRSLETAVMAPHIRIATSDIQAEQHDKLGPRLKPRDEAKDQSDFARWKAEDADINSARDDQLRESLSAHPGVLQAQEDVRKLQKDFDAHLNAEVARHHARPFRARRNITTSPLPQITIPHVATAVQGTRP
jgi:hypothetical protein